MNQSFDKIIEKYEQSLQKVHGNVKMAIHSQEKDGILHVSVNMGRARRIVYFDLYQKYGEWSAMIRNLYFYSPHIINIEIELLSDLVTLICQNNTIQFITIEYGEFLDKLIENRWEISYIIAHSNGEKLYHYILCRDFVYSQTNHTIKKATFNV